MKKYLTVFFYETMQPVFLYKDTGSLALALSKYYNWETAFGYLNICGEIKDANYENFVKLKPIRYNKNKILKWKNIINFIFQEAKKYDIINFYFGGRQELLLALLAKISNPKIKVYIKMDLVKEKYIRQINPSKKLSVKILQYFSNLLSTVVNLYTVECNSYIAGLNKINRFKDKVKYLPNGYFSDLVEIDKNIKKEKIILTVGRLGSPPKNTEMLVSAIKNIEPEKLKGWKVYLVGPMTEEFKKWFNKEIENKPNLQEVFVVTGNISDKKELYTLYARSSVFVLPSRWESWGLVVTEAMGFGCYPIVTDCCDAFHEILDNNKNRFGKIIPNENINILQESIEEVLLNNVDYVENGRMAKQFAKNHLDYKTISKNLYKFLCKDR